MVDHPLPEMMRLSLADLALRIKIMKIKLGTTIEDVLSRAMDPPVSVNIQRAVSMLVEVCLKSSYRRCLLNVSLGSCFDPLRGNHANGATAQQTSY